MNTGGLAQMTYNNGSNGYTNNNGFGSAPSGYGSRGKAAHMKRLSVAPPPGMNSIYEDEEANHVPRTARSQLLAGLRTAPKQASNVPASAPYSQQGFNFGSANYNGNTNNAHFSYNNMPQTAMASSFKQTSSPNSYNSNNYQAMYSPQEQVQASPAYNDQNETDPGLYNTLMMQQLSLLQQQAQLRQQLQNVNAAASQFQSMNLNSYQAPLTPVTPSMNMSHQQYYDSMHPVVQPTNQAGIVSVYIPTTGQHVFMYADQLSSPASPPTTTPGLDPSSPLNDNATGRFSRKDTTSPFNQSFGNARTTSPAKRSPSPQQEVTPLPPPSANAYRPGGHRRSMSNAVASAPKEPSLTGPKTADIRLSFPRTPMTGTFGPGMARAGEHPVRQPRGPPPLDELTSAPTALHDGSKNFANRQRRSAVHDLVKAVKDRQRNGSSELGTPSSEGEINFIISDADSEGSSSATGSASLSGDATFGSAKYGAAIGSEWEQLKKRAGNLNSTGMTRPFSSSGIGGLDGSLRSPRDFAGAVKIEGSSPAPQESMRSPLLVLTSAAEKRKTMM